MAFKNYGSKRTSDINYKVVEKYGKLSNNEGKMTLFDILKNIDEENAEESAEEICEE